MSSLAIRRALVAAFAAAVGVGIGHGMTLGHSHWSVITGLTLIAPAADGTWMRACLRVAGTSACAIWVIALFGVADPQPQWIIFVSLAAMVLGFAIVPYTRAQYAVTLFLPLSAMFAMSALDAPETAPTLVGDRIFFIALGAVLVTLGCVVLRCERGAAGPPPAMTLTESLDRALRIGLACVLCSVLAAVVRRPELASMMWVTTLVLGLVTGHGARRDKASLRLGGALAGGITTVLVYVFLMDSMTSIYSLMVVVFVVTWLCGLLVSMPSVSYLGVQAGMVFAWSLGDAPRPSDDLIQPLTRVFQVIAATVILMAVYRIRLPSRVFANTKAA